MNCYNLESNSSEPAKAISLDFLPNVLIFNTFPPSPLEINRFPNIPTYTVIDCNQYNFALILTSSQLLSLEPNRTPAGEKEETLLLFIFFFKLMFPHHSPGIPSFYFII